MNRKRPPARDPYRADRDDYRNDRADRPDRDPYRDPYRDRVGATEARSPEPPQKKGFNYAIAAILAGVFILGMGVGIGFSSSASVDPQNVASREFIDRAAPNPELCAQFGASAISMNARIFVTLSPFSVYVAQPEMQPGCVMRSNNWAVLQQRGVVTDKQVSECKNRMNTFAFTGSIESKPRVDCVYQNDAAGNLFLNQPGVVPAQESDRF
jgi:hypothetical protein